MNTWLLFFVLLGPAVGAVLYLVEREDPRLEAWNQLLLRLSSRYGVNHLKGLGPSRPSRMVGTAPGGHRIELRADAKVHGTGRQFVSQLKIHPNLRRKGAGSPRFEQALVHTWDGLWLQEDDLIGLIDSGLEHADTLSAAPAQPQGPQGGAAQHRLIGSYEGDWRSYLDQRQQIEQAIDRAMLHLHAKLSVTRIIEEQPKTRVMDANNNTEPRIIRYWGRPYAVRCETIWQSDDLGIFGSAQLWVFRGLPKGMKVDATVHSSARDQRLNITITVHDPERTRHTIAMALLDDALGPWNIAWASI